MGAGLATDRHEKRVVVVADPDGTLLEHRSARFPGSAALRRLVADDVPVVLCSSRTRAELEVIQHELQLRDPFISENGGALYLPRGYFSPDGTWSGYEVLSFGRPQHDVAARLRRTAAALGIAIRSFDDMSVQEVAEVCGLSLADARLAQLREYDEPFRLLEPGPSAQSRLFSALRRVGLRCVQDGPFHHATAGADVARAMRALTMLYRRHARHVVTVAISDGHGDPSLLLEADIAILVPNHDIDTARVLQRVPTARVTSAPGLRGWDEAVRSLMDPDSQAV